MHVLLDRPIESITGGPRPYIKEGLRGILSLRSRNGLRMGRSPLRIREMSCDSLCHLVYTFRYH